MQQWYQCPRCGAQVAFGTRFCGNCQTPLNWPTQQQPPPQYQQQYQPPPQYQQQYQQQPPQYQQQYQQPGYQQQPEPPKKKSKLGIILLVLGIILLASVGSCVVCVMLPGGSESPFQTPVLAPFQDDSFTIRVTGSQTVIDQAEWDRIQEQKNKEDDPHLKEVLAMSEAEYDQYVASGEQAKWATYIIDKYPTDSAIKSSPAVKFSGSYMVITSSGESTSRSVDGTTPAEYYIGSANIVSCAFQKSGKDGTLKVEILRGGKVVSSEYTTTDYGLVSVATR